MKKSLAYRLFLVLFLAATGFVVFRYVRTKTAADSTYYSLLERKGALAQAPEWASVRSRAEKLTKAVRLNPDDTKSSLGLAALFVQEARATGNYAYYDKAALKYVEAVLKKDSGDFQALILKSIILLSQHHFQEGLTIAEAAQKINPYNAFVYGILVDANVELGNYEAAVSNADKMVSIRPDLRSYSRISYLREIHGDYPGAIEAMKMAVDAGIPGDEGTEWCRVQTARLYEKTGDRKNAEMEYNIALSNRPSYPLALAGLAGLAADEKDYKKAVGLYDEANALFGGTSFSEELMDVYELINQQDKVKALGKELTNQLTKDAAEAEKDESLGHYGDEELSRLYLRNGNVEKALAHALAEYNRRPNNIDVNEAVAWVYYHRASFDKALTHIEKALKTGSKNPVLLCRAGLIYGKKGDRTRAKKYLEQGLQNNPVLDQRLKSQSMLALAKLS